MSGDPASLSLFQKMWMIKKRVWKTELHDCYHIGSEPIQGIS